MTALQTTQNSIGSPTAIITREQVELIKRTVAKGATDDELQLFLYQAQRTGLDPLSNEIYFIKVGGKVTFITSVNGYYKIAGRTNQWVGNDSEFIQDSTGKLQACKSTVRKLVEGKEYTFTATSRMTEHYKNTPTWNSMPYRMLEKCAESAALRKAFPSELGGLYTSEEMEKPKREKPPGFDPKNPEHVKFIVSKLDSRGIKDGDEQAEFMKLFTGEPSEKFDAFLDDLLKAAKDAVEVVQ